jgi:hypothetical protein
MRRIFPQIACGSLREVTAAPASMSAPPFDPTHDSVLQACQMLPRRADSSHLPGASASPWPYENRSIRQAGVWAAFFESRWGQVFLFVAISGTSRVGSTAVRDATRGVVGATRRGAWQSTGARRHSADKTYPCRRRYLMSSCDGSQHCCRTSFSRRFRASS